MYGYVTYAIQVLQTPRMLREVLNISWEHHPTKEQSSHKCYH